LSGSIISENLAGDPQMPGKSLSKKQLDAIAHLLSGSTQAAAAKAVGVNDRTLRRWYSDHPEFRSELENCRQSSYQLLLGEILGGCPVAVAALVAIAGNVDQKACDRVAASRALLSSAVRGVLGDSLDHAMSIARKYGYELRDVCPQGSQVVDEE
jgi:hypothetical protein